jgi:hypothetical protein
MCCIILGAFLYAYIIGDFSHLLTNLSQERDDFDKKMRTINGLLSFIDAPPDVRHKVQNYYDFKFENKEGSTGLMDEMPASLQVALVKHRYGASERASERASETSALSSRFIVKTIVLPRQARDSKHREKLSKRRRFVHMQVISSAASPSSRRYTTKR